MVKEVSELHAVMFPYLALGHINPFVQLANKLSSHGMQISFLSAPGNIKHIKSCLNLFPNVQIIPLSVPAVEGLPSEIHSTHQMPPAMMDLLKQAVDLMQPQVHTILSYLKPHFVFFDFLQEWTPRIASPLGIKTIVFSTFPAVSGAYLTVPARLTGVAGGNPTVDDLTKPPQGFPATSITSVKKFEARDFLFMFKSFHGRPTLYSGVLECLNTCDVIALKTCYEIEGPYLDFMKSQLQKPALLAGPLVSEPPSGQLDETWASWLDQFPAKSVIFYIFGSENYLRNDQIIEIALGLELTGLPFILVLNFPAGADVQSDLDQALPNGFVERVKGKGMVHRGWVPQRMILAHKSVGCYVCHGGFGSTMEALISECWLVFFPLKGDQFLNAKVVAGDLRAGVEVNRRDEDGFCTKEDILEAIKPGMLESDEKEPGKSIKQNHKKIRDFLLSRDNQNKLIADLVEQLKAMA